MTEDSFKNLFSTTPWFNIHLQAIIFKKNRPYKLRAVFLLLSGEQMTTQGSPTPLHVWIVGATATFWRDPSDVL